jgi:hypothetical protein
MPMTVAQLATVRRRTSAAVNEIDDAELSAIYDDTTQGNSLLDNTTYYVLRDMLGVVANALDKGNQVDGMWMKASQRSDHIQKLLDYWGMITGLGVLVDLGIAAGGIAAPCGELIDCEDCP